VPCGNRSVPPPDCQAAPTLGASRRQRCGQGTRNKKADY